MLTTRRTESAQVGRSGPLFHVTSSVLIALEMLRHQTSTPQIGGEGTILRSNSRHHDPASGEVLPAHPAPAVRELHEFSALLDRAEDIWPQDEWSRTRDVDEKGISLDLGDRGGQIR